MPLGVTAACVTHCPLFVHMQMQMNVPCLARRCVKEASVWILLAATSVTARLGRTMTLSGWSAEVSVRETVTLICV